MGVSGQRHAPGKTRHPGWAPGSVWTGADNLASTGIRSPECAARTRSLYRLSCPGPRQRVLKNYQNKWPENLERIPKISIFVSKNQESRIRVICIKNSWIADLWPRICCNLCASCRGWWEGRTEIWMDHFYVSLKVEATCWERSMWTAHTEPLFATLKATFVHCYFAETGFPTLKIIYLT